MAGAPRTLGGIGQISGEILPGMRHHLATPIHDLGAIITGLVTLLRTRTCVRMRPHPTWLWLAVMTTPVTFPLKNFDSSAARTPTRTIADGKRSALSRNPAVPYEYRYTDPSGFLYLGQAAVTSATFASNADACNDSQRIGHHTHTHTPVDDAANTTDHHHQKTPPMQNEEKNLSRHVGALAAGRRSPCARPAPDVASE